MVASLMREMGARPADLKSNKYKVVEVVLGKAIAIAEAEELSSPIYLRGKLNQQHKQSKHKMH